jgi:hypothetical protein
MLFDLVLRNGPTIYKWDGYCASDILSVVEDINPKIREYLKLVGSHNKSLLERLSSFGVKVVDAYGVCICGSQWDQLSHINEIVQGSISENGVKFIDGAFLHKVSTDTGFHYVTQVGTDFINITPNGDKWEWIITNNEGVVSESGESDSLLLAVRASNSSHNLLSGGR